MPEAETALYPFCGFVRGDTGQRSMCFPQEASKEMGVATHQDNSFYTHQICYYDGSSKEPTHQSIENND